MATHVLPSTQVIKRDGARAAFDLSRIARTIAAAGQATGEFDATEAQRIAHAMERVLAHRFAGLPPHVEQIQDLAEQQLIASGWLATARAFIAYRDRHAQLRAAERTTVDVERSMAEYLDRSDWRINANANQGYSLGGLILNVAGKVTANYWLSHIYAPEAGRAHREGDIHIHDLDMLSGYCAGWSLRRLLEEGLNGIPGRVEAGPPRHLSSAVGQMVNFLGTLQNEWAGAQAFSSFDTYLAPFLRKDDLDDAEVKQCIQEFIYNLNVPSRWGTQTPFTNITFDWTCPDDLKGQHPVVGGEEMPFTYGELEPEMERINRAYLEVMAKGDAKGRVFTFPIPTYNITRDFPWESPTAHLLFDLTARYGLPYFQNFINSDLKPNQVRSMCCRLQLDLRELLKRGNGLFGSAEQTGSVGVVTINCARLGHLHAGDWPALLKRLDELVDIAAATLETKRKVVQRLLDDGLYPYTKRYLGSLRNHFSTIGINGVNEMIRNFSGDTLDIAHEDGRTLAIAILDHLRERLAQCQERTGNLYNLEATPAEGTTYRFAREDRKRYPAILQAGTPEAPYYTNSTQLPAGFTDDPFEALTHQEAMQSRYTGGTVLHLYLREKMPTPESCRNLVRRALEHFRLPYITVTPTFSICPTHGYLSGEHTYCPRCDEVALAELNAAACAACR